jgi:hypothetical protein
MTPVDTSGSRHYGGGTPLPPPPEAWICPACGIEQTGTMAQGCPGCGAGKPGRRVLEKEGTVRTPSTVRTSTRSLLSPQTVDVPEHVLAAARQSFADRLQQAAFVAGWLYGREGVPMRLPLDYLAEIPAAGTPAVALEGSAESRTILAALQLFLDQVLRSDPEEVAEGEWLSAQDCEALIRKLKGEGS